VFCDRTKFVLTTLLWRRCGEVVAVCTPIFRLLRALCPLFEPLLIIGYLHPLESVSESTLCFSAAYIEFDTIRCQVAECSTMSAASPPGRWVQPSDSTKRPIRNLVTAASSPSSRSVGFFFSALTVRFCFHFPGGLLPYHALFHVGTHS
jgi:hypothetical protein